VQLTSQLPVTRGGRPRMSRREDWTTVGLAAWLIVGLFVDGWAHNTTPNLETFFTPWHALFYSGFAATAAWVVWSVICRIPPGQRAGLRGTTGLLGSNGLLGSSGRLGSTGLLGRAGREVIADAVPVGYGYALAGLVVFGISGLGDLTWHQIFGIEQNIKALLSPTHLGLVTGAFLIVTAPARSQAASTSPGPDSRPGNATLAAGPGASPGPGASAAPAATAPLPAIVSVTLASCLIGFILQQWNPLENNPATYDSAFGALQIQGGVAEYLLATIFLFGPLLWLAQRWRLPFLAPAVLIGVQAVLIQAMIGLPAPGLAGLGVLGGLAVGGLAVAIRPGPGSAVRNRVFMTVAPPVFWLIAVIGIASPAGPGLGWEPEVWGGSVVWSALVGLGMTLLSPTLSPTAPRAGDPSCGPTAPVDAVPS